MVNSLGKRTVELDLAAAEPHRYSLIWTYCTPFMLSDQGANWGVKTAFFFSGTSAIGGVVYWLFMPEVSQTSLASADRVLV